MLHILRRVTHQWRRRVWRKADIPSMVIRMDVVSTAHTMKIRKIMGPPIHPLPKPILRTMNHSTSDSSKDRAKRSSYSLINSTRSGWGSNFCFCFDVFFFIFFKFQFVTKSFADFACDLEGATTYERELNLGPIDGDKTLCERWTPGRTRWCEWPKTCRTG